MNTFKSSQDARRRIAKFRSASGQKHFEFRCPFLPCRHVRFFLNLLSATHGLAAIKRTTFLAMKRFTPLRDVEQEVWLA